MNFANLSLFLLHCVISSNNPGGIPWTSDAFAMGPDAYAQQSWQSDPDTPESAARSIRGKAPMQSSSQTLPTSSGAGPSSAAEPLQPPRLASPEQSPQSSASMSSAASYGIGRYELTEDATSPFQRQMIGFIQKCMARQLGGTEFMLKGIDPGSGRFVDLSFSLSDRSGLSKCDLYIMATGKGPGRLQTLKILNQPEPPPVKKSFLQSLWEKMNNKREPYKGTPYIHISVYVGDEDPHWELTSLMPSGHVSGMFFKSFVAQGIAIHSRMAGKKIELRLNDQSSIRQQYWLVKKSGKTYYQAKWNLEYTCYTFEGPTMPDAYLQAIQIAFASSPQPAFADMNFNPVIVDDGTGFTEQWEFNPKFIFTLKMWIMKNKMNIPKMNTIKEALDKWIPYYTNRMFGLPELQVYATNTFLFFFRHHEDFSMLAQQALGLARCKFMRGVPIDDPHVVFEAFHRPMNILAATPVRSVEVQSPALINRSRFSSCVLIAFGLLLIFSFFLQGTRESKVELDYYHLEL